MSRETYHVNGVAIRGEQHAGSGLLEVTWNLKGKGTWTAAVELSGAVPAIGEEAVSVVLETDEGPVLRGLGLVGAGNAPGWIQIAGAGSFRLG